MLREALKDDSTLPGPPKGKVIPATPVTLQEDNAAGQSPEEEEKTEQQ